MGSLPHWKETALRRRQAQTSAIPEEWRMKSIPPDFKVSTLGDNSSGDLSFFGSIVKRLGRC